MKSKYFTFGQSHAHAVGGFTYDKDIVVKIVSPNPRASMFELFDDKWAFEYDEKPDMSFYPRGVRDISHTPAYWLDYKLNKKERIQS